MSERKPKPETKVVPIRLPVEILDKVDLIAFVEKRTRSNMIRVMVEQAVEVHRVTSVTERTSVTV